MTSTNIVKDRIAHLEVGEPNRVGGLTLVPLFGTDPAPDYFTAAEALAHGLLDVEELGSGTVPEIVAINKAGLPVLLVDGEHLEGAMQSRIVNLSILLGANSKTHLPVSCVGQGRWAYEGRRKFSSSDHHAYGRLRRVQAESALLAAKSGMKRRSDQGAVWADVAFKHAEAAVMGSRSGAMRDAYDRQADFLREVGDRMARPAPRQVGVVSCIGGRPIAVDAFDQPATPTKLWQRLVRGYAMDAVGATSIEVGEVDVKAFLAEASQAEATVHAGAGIGDDVVLEARGVLGTGLVWSERVVHLALFRREDASDGRSPGSGGTTERPIRPRRRFFHSS